MNALLAGALELEAFVIYCNISYYVTVLKGYTAFCVAYACSSHTAFCVAYAHSMSYNFFVFIYYVM